MVVAIGLLVLTVPRMVYGICKFPGGALAANYIPCDPLAYTSLCCPIGWTCFSNNLCIITIVAAATTNQPVGTAIRGTCTDPQWNNAACGDFCLNEPLYENNGSLVSCGNGSWCCQPESVSGTCNCSTGQGTFSVGEGIAQTTIELGGATSTVTVTEIVLPAPPSTPLSAESSAVTHTLINGPALNSSATPADPLLSAMATERESISVSQSNPTASITYSSVSSSTTAAVEILPTSAAHYSPQDKNVTHSKGFEIGAPVGGMAVIALLAVASYYAYGYCQSKRKRKRRETIIPNPHVLQSSIYADQLSNGPDNTNPFGPRNSQRSNDELQLNTLPYSRNGSDEGNPFMRTSPSNTNRPPPPQAPPRFAPSNNRSAPPPVPPRFASYNHTPSPPPPPPPSRFSPPTTTQILADAERTVPMRPERPAGGRRTNNDRRGQYSRVPDTSRAERPDWQNMQNRL